MSNVIYLSCMGGRNMREKITIFDVAKYFINKSDDESPMTPLKLQKLCYYAQAWSLVWEKEPLFDDDFAAWIHGPANYSLFKRYQGRRYINCDGEEDKFDSSKFSEDQLETLEVVWDTYGKYTGDYLEQLTHEEDPWIITRGKLSPGDNCTKIITKELIQNYYTEVYNGEE